MLCWVFVSVRGPSLVVASGGHSSSQCAGLSLSRPLLLRSTGSRCAGSVVVAHRPSCSAARGILPDQGSNPCPLHWQADSQPLRHQGSPIVNIFMFSYLALSFKKILFSSYSVYSLVLNLIPNHFLIFYTMNWNSFPISIHYLFLLVNQNKKKVFHIYFLSNHLTKIP